MRKLKESRVYIKCNGNDKQKLEAQEKIAHLQSCGYKRLSDNGKTVIMQRLR